MARPSGPGRRRAGRASGTRSRSRGLPRCALRDYDAELADRMGGYWVRFAATGDPNHDGAPDWPAYDPAEPRWMEFGAHTGAQRARVLAEVAP